jgi:hypothetical protein
MEKQRNLDAQNLKAQLDSIHDVLDTKVPWVKSMGGWSNPMGIFIRFLGTFWDLMK